MTLAIEFHQPGADLAHALTSFEWRSEAFDFWIFDRRADDLHARRKVLHVIAPPVDVPSLRREIVIRTQRLAAQRNACSGERWFTRVVEEHRRLHDLSKPLVRADLDHALDTWQWTLRLDAHAPAAVQLAALLHDIERLTSEADVRIEHLASDYQAYKDAHAAAGARFAASLFERAGVPSGIAQDACALIAAHERAGESPRLRAVNDADALSFFSFNSPGYLRYFGPEHTAKKVEYTYRRMSPSARGWLDLVRIPSAIRDQVQRCAS
ncbi:MAG TPA: DUF4202 family protein [Kofleriaceae bacterium]|nr:DUF4202 family protein [Kofleriaceae bacterium]